MLRTNYCQHYSTRVGISPTCLEPGWSIYSYISVFTEPISKGIPNQGGLSTEPGMVSETA